MIKYQKTKTLIITPQLPTLSIIIPVINVTKNQIGMVQGLIAKQDYPPKKFEVLYVTSNSSTVTQAIKGINERFIENPENELTKVEALTKGCRQARGKVIAFYDPGDQADDPFQFRQAVSFLYERKYNAVQLRFKGGNIRQPEDKPLLVHTSNLFLTKEFFQKTGNVPDSYFQQNIGFCDSLVRKSFKENIVETSRTRIDNESKGVSIEKMIVATVGVAAGAVGINIAIGDITTIQWLILEGSSVAMTLLIVAFFKAELRKLIEYRQLPTETITNEVNEPMLETAKALPEVVTNPEPKIIQTQKVIKCTNCGTELTAGARFCNSCGMQTPPEEEEVVITPPPPPIPPAKTYSVVYNQEKDELHLKFLKTSNRAEKRIKIPEAVSTYKQIGQTPFLKHLDQMPYANANEKAEIGQDISKSLESVIKNA